MVETINCHRLYQATSTNTYKTALAINQRIIAGTEYNPFFRFYENCLEYPVTDSQSGETIHVNAIEWLHRVKAGTIHTTFEMFAEKSLEVSQHYMMLARELIMEEIRFSEFAGAPPSRQKCLYLTESTEEAKRWIPLLGEQVTICEVSCTGVIHRADSRLMMRLSEPLSVTRENARAYWRGDVSADPRIELLFEGDAIVTGVDL